jgi:hypothetical protein
MWLVDNISYFAFMNPYHVLGVPEDASDEQIKTAYRRLAKQYHPDRNKSGSAVNIIQRVNEAYEILSDPARKARYGKSNYIPDDQSAQTAEEHAYEEYKREFLKRKREEAAKNIAKAKLDEQRKYKNARLITMPILLFALLLTIDEFLPPNHYRETSEEGWQFTESAGRNSRGRLLTFMRTKNFIMQVPYQVHLDYDYDNPGIIDVYTSRTLDIPKEVVAYTKHNVFTFAPGGEIYSGFFHVHWLLLLSASFIAYQKKFSVINYTFRHMPLLLLTIEIVLMWPRNPYPH